MAILIGIADRLVWINTEVAQTTVLMVPPTRLYSEVGDPIRECSANLLPTDPFAPLEVPRI